MTLIKQENRIKQDTHIITGKHITLMSDNGGGGGGEGEAMPR